MPRVAVEDSLTQVKSYLAKNGYDIVGLNKNIDEEVDAIIISGGDKDVMGRQDIVNLAPVINAEGMTAEEVYETLRERI